MQIQVGFDVDGLRCVARLRVAVGWGVWRANHLTIITAWAAAADNINNSAALAAPAQLASVSEPYPYLS